MRQHNKYLDKVYEEMSVFREHLLTGRELTPTQQETFEKISVARGWLKDGYSDTEVIQCLKNDPIVKVQDRRAREILAMAYETFAELRQLRNKEGIKFMYAELFREAAYKAKQELDWDAYMKLMKEAAKIDGAYDEIKSNMEEKKRPTKIVIKRVEVNNNYSTTPKVEDTNYELIGTNTEHPSE
ncbi:hypothetical protein [Cellulophaga sp. BC115SP]|uniref:hypothetical protein n=1 Tax=Cellulophaga sp. BC115SP TaxID=2683263 RepID=UPI001412018D|nr:hypothetical protein [Cellulophaga sp. BC115SP]NBB31951.1 hypothetical protein [Cellulophaga sp. BC115SP]